MTTPANLRRAVRTTIVIVVALALSSAGTWLYLQPAETRPFYREPGERVVTFEPTTATTATGETARITAAVLVTDTADPATILELEGAFADAVVRHVANLDGDELRSDDGGTTLRRHLTSEAAELWGDDTVRRALLTELIIHRAR